MKSLSAISLILVSNLSLATGANHHNTNIYIDPVSASGGNSTANGGIGYGGNSSANGGTAYGGGGGYGGMGGAGGSSTNTINANPVNTINNHDYSANSNTNHNSSGSNSSSDSASNSSATNQGNAQHVNFNAPRQHYNNPGLMSIMSVPTANCAIPIGVTGAALGVGGGIMSAVRLDECIKQENVKLAYAIGEQETAMEVFCSMENTKDTLKCMILNKQIEDKKQQLLGNSLVNASQNTKTNMFGMIWNEQRGWVFP